MSIAKVIEISAASKEGFAEAVHNGIAKVGKTVDNVKGAWVKEMNVVVDGGKVTEYRVDMKVTFLLKE